jgi:hypothetical protein
MTKTLNIKCPIRSIVVSENHAFHYGTAYGFDYPESGQISFALHSDQLTWLRINERTGHIHGHTPKIHGDREQFLITVVATMGNKSLTQDFFISIASSNTIENMTRFLLKLHEYPYTVEKQKHEILDFIFEYYRVSVYKNDFMHLLRDHAKEKHIDLPENNDDIEYSDFKEVAEAFHPDIEKELQEKLEEEHILSEAELSRQEMSDLFREGAQPPGTIPIAVWNYLGETSYRNASEIKSVLHEAVHAIRKLHEHVQDSHIHYKPTHR